MGEILTWLGVTLKHNWHYVVGGVGVAGLIAFRLLGYGNVVLTGNVNEPEQKGCGDSWFDAGVFGHNRK